ncbi:MAG: hypothetical protein ACM31C_09355 [Acidobacteriota bacterium]
MTDGEVRGWRALPPVLVVAIVLDACTSLAGIAWSRFAHELTSEHKWGLAIRGIYFAITVLSVVGYVELARRRTGWARRGLHAAAILVAADTLLWVVIAWYFAIHPSSAPGWFGMFWKISAMVLRAAPAIALAMAAWDRRVLAIAGLVLVAAVDAAHYFLDDLLKWLGAGDKGYFTVISIISLVGTVSLALLAFAAARGLASPEPRRAAHGLSRAAGALQLRVVAAIAGSGLGLFVALMSPNEGALELVKLGMFSGLVINFLADLWFSVSVLGASRAELPDLPRWPLAIAGAMIAWCSGVLLEKAPEMYEVLYGSHAGGREAIDALALFSLALPVVETLGIAVLAALIGGLASRRSLPELATHASGKGVGFVALMLAGIAITQWVIPAAKSEGGLILMMLCALVAILAAMILMMRLCRYAAEAVEQEPGLPAAKLVT